MIFAGSSILTSVSILVSVFGSLYAVYAAAMRDGGAPICIVLRRLAAFLLVFMISALGAACYIIWVISGLPENPVPRVTAFLAFLLPIGLLVMPVVITRAMWKDG
jgi:hypothetical protein